MTKFEPDEYRHESNAVSLLNYHFVFIPKRRKKVLVGAIAERLQQIICDLVIENRWKIIALEIMPDTNCAIRLGENERLLSLKCMPSRSYSLSYRLNITLTT